MYRIIVILSLLLSFQALLAQFDNETIFSDIKIVNRFGTFGVEDVISFNDQDLLSFYYERNEETVELFLLPKEEFSFDTTLQVIPSSDYEIVESLLFYENGYYRTKLKFNNLNDPSLLKILFQKHTDTINFIIEEIILFPTTTTEANFFTLDEQVYLGEEKIYEIETTNPENILINTEWITSGAFDYRVERKFGELILHVIAREAGLMELNVQLHTHRPYIDSNGELSNSIIIPSRSFLVKKSRLKYLDLHINEVTFNEKNRFNGFNIQIDDYPSVEIGQTYRLENQEEPGGALIAEIYIVSRLSNNRLMGIMRVYNMHRKSEGYLYIKERDRALSITNLDITPQSSISRIMVMKEGENWSEDLTVKPGEKIRVGIEGEGLHKSRFYWEGAVDITPDSILRTEKYAFFLLDIPINITQKNILLYNKGEPTGHRLRVQEFQRPRDFDFITINYGTGDKRLNSISGPIIHDQVINDIVFDFDRDRIDLNNIIYGKQYFDIEIKITGARNELIELKTINSVAICPGELSPRYSNYSRGDCEKTALSLNKYLKRKTYDLDDWVKIELVVKHTDSKYDEPIISQEIDIIVQKPYRFDIDVSFPAGLIIKRFGIDDSGNQFDNFGGISMAMIAQFSFYDPQRIGKFKPYKVGAGFLALNAFNFSEDATRDVAIVILGSLYPTRKDVKLTFPLYFGGGYFLGDKKFFVLVGPGIRISL